MQLAAIRGMSPQNIISKVLDETFGIIIQRLRGLFAHHLTVPLSASARWL
jgi:hypothetical protein